MPAAPRIITLNIGSQTVGLAEFRVQAHGGLVLLDYRLREIPADPAGDPAGVGRRAQVALVLREMMDELQIKRGRVNYAVSAQSVFARFVKLPAVDEEKVEKIVSFEAQQNVPFPIDEVVWDYQLVWGGGDEQIQVVLVAIKRDLLEQINSAVEETGLRTSTVDVAPMALYNAFRYNYSDLDGCSLLVYALTVVVRAFLGTDPLTMLENKLVVIVMGVALTAIIYVGIATFAAEAPECPTCVNFLTRNWACRSSFLIRCAT